MSQYTPAPHWDSSVVWIWVRTCTWVMFPMPTMFLSQQDTHLDLLVKNCFVYDILNALLLFTKCDIY